MIPLSFCGNKKIQINSKRFKFITVKTVPQPCPCQYSTSFFFKDFSTLAKCLMNTDTVVNVQKLNFTGYTVNTGGTNIFRDPNCALDHESSANSW